MKAVIIDDEQAGHNNINSLLIQHHSEIEVVGSAYDVSSGIELIQSTQPELLFLDIELTDGTAFDLLAQIEAEKHLIIFVSSYNKYAIQAFDFAAMAYLTKPTAPEKLSQALRRAQIRFEQRNKLQRLEDIFEVRINFEQQKLPSRLAVSNTEGLHLIELDAIEWIAVQDSLVNIHETSSKTTYVSGNLVTYDRRLRPFRQFYRLSPKSPIVNLQNIIRIESDEVIFRSGKRVTVPRGKGAALRNRLETI